MVRGSPPRPSFLRPRRAAIGLALVIGGIALLLMMPGPSHPAAAPAVDTLRGSASGSLAAAAPALDLSVAATPSAVCLAGTLTCAAGVDLSRVTLTANAPQSTYLTWPAVEVTFVIETTMYDGVFDPVQNGPTGYDQCALANDPAGPACEESNGVPFFLSNAQSIANAIAAANPHSIVSFALVDYFATLDIQDDGDGVEYHVDIAHFVPAGQFGPDVDSSLASQVLISGYRLYDSDTSDNFLHSSSITALYGAIIGSGLDWSPQAHHVVVWIGSTAPRAPGYTQDYCVSPSEWYPPGGPDAFPCMSSSCEPSYTFGSITSPECEGWVNSQNGNSSDSIAALAHEAPACTTSIGGVCTIDTIDLWTTPTDPSSPGWPAGDNTPTLGGGPSGPMVDQNAARVLFAGCDLAAATGGSWDGPSFFECPSSGQTGTLTPTFLGSYLHPNLQNTALFTALKGVSFGPVTSSLVATGTNHPLFTFVPFGSVVVLPGAQAQFQTACEFADGTVSRTCPVEPTETSIPTGPGTNTTVYGWNWSTVASQNEMYSGDTWIASFWVEAVGPPFGQVPVDACVTTFCRLGGSSALDGFYTAATYLPVTNASVVVQSFPLAQLGVEASPTPPPVATLPPPTPTPPPAPILAPTPLGLLTPVGVAAQVGVASLSLQAAGAGFIAAGFTAITVRNRPMSIAVAALATKTAPVRSRFEESTLRDAAGVGHFE